MRRALTFVLATACGLTVANLYYSQPLLDLIADAFGVSQGAATVVVTLTQIGYALGLLFLLPLGDLVENRRLSTRLLAGAAGAPLGVLLAFFLDAHVREQAGEQELVDVYLVRGGVNIATAAGVNVGGSTHFA